MSLYWIECLSYQFAILWVDCESLTLSFRWNKILFYSYHLFSSSKKRRFRLFVNFSMLLAIFLAWGILAKTFMCRSSNNLVGIMMYNRNYLCFNKSRRISWWFELFPYLLVFLKRAAGAFYSVHFTFYFVMCWNFQWLVKKYFTVIAMHPVAVCTVRVSDYTRIKKLCWVFFCCEIHIAMRCVFGVNKQFI